MFRLIAILAFIVLNTSCKELFTPKIEISKTPLVVDGLITDEAKPYSVKLSRAIDYFNIIGNDYASVRGAEVIVSDDCGNTYNFNEIDAPGVYVSDPSEFVGVPGRSYVLFIKTNDNIEYRSAPQLLLPNDFTVKVYAEFGTHYQLVDDGLGTYVNETIDGTNIFYDIENNEDTLIRFRFDHKTYKQYIEEPEYPKSGDTPNYCWGLLQNNDLINITDNYVTSSNNIEKHTVCFVPDIKPQYYPVMVNGKQVGWVRVVMKLITRIIQYRLNNESYQYYKNINTMLAATGKIFDPIPFQLKGNINCISDKSIEVLGFFETSSIRISYFVLSNGSKTFRYLNGYDPPYDFGCLTPDTPPFYVW